MKKLNLLFTALLLLCCVGTAKAEEATIDGIKYDVVTKAKLATVISGETKYSGDIVIPSEITYNNVVYSVTSIGSYAFRGCRGLTSIVIGSSVTSIGERAFYNCSFTNIVIPAGATSIGRQAFGSNRNLTEVTSLIPAENLFEVSNLISMTNAGKRNGIYKLYVPIGAKETYKATAGWNEFSEIIEVDLTAIDEVLDEVKSESGKVKTVYYDLSGRVVENPTNGVYIIDGKKVLIK